MEDILTRQRKEFKALDGEKRAAIKKAKTTKGKKAKDEIQAYVLLFHGTCIFL
jgi:NAD(P)H-hydrate repair Nnr-like enzyme with NAD(P)H-hydrate dehydratase domain